MSWLRYTGQFTNQFIGVNESHVSISVSGLPIEHQERREGSDFEVLRHFRIMIRIHPDESKTLESSFHLGVGEYLFFENFARGTPRCIKVEEQELVFFNGRGQSGCNKLRQRFGGAG